MQRGVIRSHKYYPNNQKTPLQPRTIRIYVRPSYTLYMDLFRPDGCLNKTDITLKRVKNGKRRLIGEAFGRKHSFHSNDTDYVELTVRKSNPGSSCPGGFILPFSCKLRFLQLIHIFEILPVRMIGKKSRITYIILAYLQSYSLIVN